MIDVLFKAFSFVAVIVCGYIIKKKGGFGDSALKLVSALALNITLPASVISSFAAFKKDNTIFMLMLLGLGINLAMSFFAFVISRKRSRGIGILYMMNCPGFNIGSFSLPFIQGFIGPSGVVTACMFDTGNALMTCGGNYALTCAAVGSGAGKKFGVKDFAYKLLSSVPFDTYLAALLLAIFNVRLPQPAVNLLSTAAGANGFMAMLMLGLSLDFDISKEYMTEIIKLLILKYGLAAFCAYIIYFKLPLDSLLKSVLTIIVFSPTSALVPAFTQKLDGNVKASGFIASASIVISVAVITIIIAATNFNV